MDAYGLNSSAFFASEANSTSTGYVSDYKLAQTFSSSVFAVTEDSTRWLQLSICILATTLCGALYYKYELEGITSRQIAYFSLALSAFSYWWLSWTAAGPATDAKTLLDLRTTGENTTFVVTHDAFGWVPYSVCFTLLYGAAFFHAPQLKSSYKQIAAIALVASLFLVVPFLGYLLTGLSWTGQNLKELHRRMIDGRHAILMACWMVFSIVQLVTYIIKKQKIHNQVGKFVVNGLLPLIFLELFGNAVRVFWPEKPHVLAMGIHSANAWPIPESPEDLTISQMLLYTLPSLFALTTPAIMVMYYCLSNRALDRTNGKKRDIRLHIVYMCCFIYSAMAAGSLRWLIRKSFKASNCTPQTDAAIAALMQYMGQAWTGFIYTALLTAIYLTLPLETRRNNTGVKWSYLVYMVISTLITPMAGWASGVPFGIECVVVQ